MRPLLVLLLLAVVSAPPYGAAPHVAVEVQSEIVESEVPESPVADPPAARAEMDTQPAASAGAEVVSALRQMPEDPPPEA